MTACKSVQFILHVWIKILLVFVCADAESLNMEKHAIWNLTKEPILIFHFRTNEKLSRVSCKNRKEVRIGTHRVLLADDQEVIKSFL